MAIRVAMATGGWVLLGELDKYTTVSARRFTSIKTDASGLELSLAGAAGEKHRLLFSNFPYDDEQRWIFKTGSGQM